MKKISLLMLLMVWGSVFYASVGLDDIEIGFSFDKIATDVKKDIKKSNKLPSIQQSRFVSPYTVTKDNSDPYRLFKPRYQNQAAYNSDASYLADLEVNTDRLSRIVRESSSGTPYELPSIKNNMQTAESPYDLTISCTPVSQIQPNSPVPFNSMYGKSVLPMITPVVAINRTSSEDERIDTVSPLPQDRNSQLLHELKVSPKFISLASEQAYIELDNRRKKHEERIKEQEAKILFAAICKEREESRKLKPIRKELANAGPMRDKELNTRLSRALLHGKAASDNNSDNN